MKILMVCLGNICRSPMAQGIMESLVRENGLNWYVDSAGTNGYHNGEAPDPRAIKVMKKRGIDISHQVSRKIDKKDIDDFDYIFSMDAQNYQYIHSICESDSERNKLRFLSDAAFPGENREVPDPYYDHSFEKAIDLIDTFCRGIILKNNGKIV